MDIPGSRAGDKLHIIFPELFNTCRLYINGREVARRKQNTIWRLNDYRFNWDVDLAGILKPGRNSIAVRVESRHHMVGMFRRPFIYAAR